MGRADLADPAGARDSEDQYLLPSKTAEFSNMSLEFQWRELAIEHLPTLRNVILAAGSHVDLWWAFKERLAEARTTECRKAEVGSIYGYAWWCVANSGDGDLATEVETYFYEDLPVYTDFKEQIPLFINPSQFLRLESCWRHRLTDEEYSDFRSRYFAQRPRSGN
jgi:hypothetical protein